MNDFQKEVGKVAADASAIIGIIKMLAYPLLFIAGFVVGLMF